MQRTDDLFIEYVRILRATKPRAFVAENVTGLVRGVSKGYFKIIYRELEESGYNVQARVLDASYLGVPQARQRVIFIGTRSDLSIAPVFPKPLPYRYSLQDAIADLESPWAKDGYAYDAETKQRIDLRDTALGKEWPAAARDQPHRFFNLSVAKKHLPIPTLVAKAGGRGTASVTHYEPRKFTLAEGRRLCGFPDDFALVGTYAERMERLGRAVPPVMMSKIAATLVKILTI